MQIACNKMVLFARCYKLAANFIYLIDCEKILTRITYLCCMEWSVRCGESARDPEIKIYNLPVRQSR